MPGHLDGLGAAVTVGGSGTALAIDGGVQGLRLPADRR
jgi:hypothetical protein